MAATYGTVAADVRVGIGPSIGPESYQVGEDVIQMAIAKLPGGERYFCNSFGEHANPSFDLWQANIDQFNAAGITSSQIEIAGIDTGAQYR